MMQQVVVIRVRVIKVRWSIKIRFMKKKIQLDAFNATLHAIYGDHCKDTALLQTKTSWIDTSLQNIAWR